MKEYIQLKLLLFLTRNCFVLMPTSTIAFTRRQNICLLAVNNPYIWKKKRPRKEKRTS